MLHSTGHVLVLMTQHSASKGCRRRTQLCVCKICNRVFHGHFSCLCRACVLSSKQRWMRNWKAKSPHLWAPYSLHPTHVSRETQATTEAQPQQCSQVPVLAHVSRSVHSDPSNSFPLFMDSGALRPLGWGPHGPCKPRWVPLCRRSCFVSGSDSYH